MRPLIWKDAFYPGRVHKNGELYDFKPEDVANAATLGNARLAEYAVPLCWEHDPEAKPLGLSAAAERARSTFGWVKAYRVDSSGVMQAGLEIEDAEDRERFRKAKFVSPGLRKNWIGEDGREWPGWNVMHLAATPVPVQKQQKPVELSRGSQSGLICLSLSDYEGKKMADEKDDDKPEVDEDEDKGEDSETEPEPEEMPAPTAYFKEAIGALKAKGINLPDDTTPENAFERIHIACMQGEPEGDPNAMPDPTTDPGAVEQSTQPAPVGLSHAEQKSKSRADKMTRVELKKRFDALLQAGVITPPIVKKRSEQVNKVNLSYDDDGELKPNEVTIVLDAYEALPKGSAWSERRKDGAQLSNADAPASPYDGDSDEANTDFEKSWEATGAK